MEATTDFIKETPVYELQPPNLSKWSCHLFGSTGNDGITYIPAEGAIPNRFVRWMMKVCFACTWVKEKSDV